MSKISIQNTFLTQYLDFNDFCKDLIKTERSILLTIKKIINYHELYLPNHIPLINYFSHNLYTIHYLNYKDHHYDNEKKLFLYILNYMKEQYRYLTKTVNENFLNDLNNKKIIEHFFFLQELSFKDLEYYVFFESNKKNNSLLFTNIVGEQSIDLLLLNRCFKEYYMIQAMIEQKKEKHQNEIYAILQKFQKNVFSADLLKLEFKEINKLFND